MFLVGLTGGIASGKSTVSKIFKTVGCPIVDADLIAREVVEPGTTAWKKIKATFGDEVFLPDGQLNREKLGQIVFADSEKRHILNGITHPEIRKAMMWRLFWLLLQGHQFVIMDIPLLFETKAMLPLLTFTIVVSCSDEQQLCRLQKRNSLSKDDAQLRINAQMPLAEKCHMATYVIDNSGSVINTQLQVKAILDKLRNSRQHWKLRIVLLSVFIALGSVAWYYLFS